MKSDIAAGCFVCSTMTAISSLGHLWKGDRGQQQTPEAGGGRAAPANPIIALGGDNAVTLIWDG